MNTLQKLKIAVIFNCITFVIMLIVSIIVSSLSDKGSVAIVLVWIITGCVFVALGVSLAHLGESYNVDNPDALEDASVEDPCLDLLVCDMVSSVGIMVGGGISYAIAKLRELIARCVHQEWSHDLMGDRSNGYNASSNISSHNYMVFGYNDLMRPIITLPSEVPMRDVESGMRDHAPIRQYEPPEYVYSSNEGMSKIPYFIPTMDRIRDDDL